jgi:hypothetical protein
VADTAAIFQVKYTGQETSDIIAFFQGNPTVHNKMKNSYELGLDGFRDFLNNDPTWTPPE